MDRDVFVYVDLQGTPHFVGRLWGRTRKGRESATFEYDKSWLANPERFSLEPALTLGPGPFHAPSEKPLFGAIGDSAPDRWGRVLMRRAERRRAERQGETPRTVREIDYLLMVDDEARQGALRFAESEGGPFLAAYARAKIPPLIELPHLLSAAEHVTAVTVAAKNKVDLALGVSLGSSIQIALFVTLIVVILGWILDKDMSLYFNLFETATLFVSTFIVNFLVLDGRSNYLEGALLCTCYVIIA